MLDFTIRRVINMVLVLLAVLTIVFLMLHVMPGDPARLALGDQATAKEVALLHEQLGLNQPILQQYGRFLLGLAKGNVGVSYVTGRPVLADAATALGYTLQLAFAALFISVAIGIPLGVLAAAKPNSLVSDFTMVLSVVGVAIPSFWLGLLLMLVFSLWLNLLPSAGADGWKNLILPAVTLSMWSVGTIARMTRASMSDVLGADHVRTARAKGLPESAVLLRHGLRNALIPVLTMISLRFGYMMGGAVATETVFNWPGLGRYILSSVLSRDYPSVQIGILLFCVSFLIVNLIADLSYALVDPRIKY